MSAPAHAALLRALKRERLHIEPRALESSSPRVRRHFAHAWAPADLLLERLAAWPQGLIAFWLAAPAGHVVLTGGSSAYLPTALPWPGGPLQAVARVSLGDLLGDARPALQTIAQLADHLLGSQGAPDGPWLSDGAGATADLRTVGERIQALARLGYGPSDPHAYFAWAFAGYWLDRQGLNTSDPHVERLLRTTLCHEGFWTGRSSGHE